MLEEAFKQELQVLIWINRYWRNNAFHRAILSVSSKNILYDWSICIIALGLLCIYYRGHLIAWNLILTYLAIRILRLTLTADRPANVDFTLKPRLSVRGSGIVSPLVVFATVVLIHLGLLTNTFPGAFLCIVLLLVCSYSRVLSMVHFPHQVVFSWAVGILCYAIHDQVTKRQLFNSLSKNGKLIVTFAGIILVLIDFAVSVDDCTSEFKYMNLEKKEYVRVMDNIMASDATTPAQRGGAPPKRDSFVKLVRSMERRSFNIPLEANIKFDNFRGKIV